MPSLHDYHQKVAHIRANIAQGAPLSEVDRAFIAHHGLYLPEEIIPPSKEYVNNFAPMEKIFLLPAFYWYAENYLDCPRFREYWLTSSVRQTGINPEYAIHFIPELCDDIKHPLFQNLTSSEMNTIWFTNPSIKAAFLPERIWSALAKGNYTIITSIFKEKPDLAIAFLEYSAEQMRQGHINKITEIVLSMTNTATWDRHHKEQWIEQLLDIVSHTTYRPLSEIAVQHLSKVLPESHADWYTFFDALHRQNLKMMHSPHMPYNYPKLFDVVNIPSISTAVKHITLDRWNAMTFENQKRLGIAFGLRGVTAKKLSFKEDLHYREAYQEGYVLRQMGVTEEHYKEQHTIPAEEVHITF